MKESYNFVDGNFDASPVYARENVAEYRARSGYLQIDSSRTESRANSDS